MVIDISPVIQTLVGLSATALGIVGSTALYKLTQKFNLQITAGQQAAYDSALHKVLTYGATQATNAIARKGWDHPDVHNEIVGTAILQAVQSFPEALAGVGLTTDLSDPKNTASLTADLQRALPAAMAEAAVSPATPPTTAPNPETRAEVAHTPAIGTH